MRFLIALIVFITIISTLRTAHSYTILKQTITPYSVVESEIKEIKKITPYEISYENIIDQRELKCLTDNIYFESRNETIEGQQAVALVTLNRKKSKHYPNTICNVVHQRTKYTCQFSWVCDKNLYVKNHKIYDKCKKIAKNLILNYNKIKDFTYGSLNYHRDDIRPVWAKRDKVTTIIGRHIFYKL